MNSEIRMTEAELRRQVIKSQCELDHLFFTRYFFKKRTGIKFLVNWHHYILADAVQQIFNGSTENIVVNISPGSSKTEIAVINLIAHGIALNPIARFLHLSSGAELAFLNSQTARDIVISDEFQELWPLHIAPDAKAKHRWNVMDEDKKAGGVYATALGGQITGFRAGHMVPGFSGCISVDDPLKAEDIYSIAAVKRCNRTLLSTVKSRRANPTIPMFLIMQRLGENDPTGFIKDGNLPGKWKFINVPALVTDEYIADLPKHLQDKVDSAVRDEKGRFSYWPYKEPLNELLELEAGHGKDPNGNIISKHVFNAQYMQSPKPIGGNIIRGEWFPRVRIPPIIKYRKIYADTAQKIKEHNDYSVFECWGMGDDGKIYLLDLLRGKWEAPELKRRAVEFWHKHLAIKNQGALREFKVEDKSSGTGLIQELKNTDKIPVKGIERDKDKLTRVMDIASFIESGYVCLIEGSPFINDFINECEAFTPDNTHAHDDQVDPLCDAISDMLASKPKGFMDIQFI